MDYAERDDLHDLRDFVSAASRRKRNGELNEFSELLRRSIILPRFTLFTIRWVVILGYVYFNRHKQF